MTARRHRILQLIAGALLLSPSLAGDCDGFGLGSSNPGTPSTYTPPPPPAAEPVTYDLLGDAKILFLGNQLFLADGQARTSTVVYLVTADAMLSPDGSRVAFTSGLDRVIATVDASHRTTITTAAFAGGPASWAPDGNSIVFAVGDGIAGPTPTIYRQRLDGVDNPIALSTIPNVVNGPYGNNSLVCPVLYPRVDGAVSMAPSGDVAFTCLGRSLYAVNGNTPPRLLYDVPADSLGKRMLRVPTWDPTGTRIAFFDEAGTGGNGRRNDIRVLDIATGVITTIATLPASSASQLFYESRDAWSMCWLPGGTRIVFTMPYAENSSQIYVVSASGGEPVRLTMGGRDTHVSCAR